jgi:hypothetical protein
VLHQILSLARLPISPPRPWEVIVCHNFRKCQSQWGRGRPQVLSFAFWVLRFEFAVGRSAFGVPKRSLVAIDALGSSGYL